MFAGELLAIHITEKRGGELTPVPSCAVVAGRGLAADRYFRNEGAGEPKQEITLIEEEALAALARDCDIQLSAPRSRRNLLTRGVPLNHLVGREFTVGSVVLFGLQLCEPCRRLEALSGAGLIAALKHRGGLRAEVRTNGTIHVGDPIRPKTAG